MRTYGRVAGGGWTADSNVITADSNQSVDGGTGWVQVSTDANGNNDYVYLTALCQCLQLNLNESPFYAQFGIPQQQSIIAQVFPDYYASVIQQTFSPYFASLLITRPSNSYPPTYDVNVTFHSGVQVTAGVPVPV